MSLKKYTDFENSKPTIYTVSDKSIYTEEKSVIVENNSIKEEVLLTPNETTNNFKIEILEDKIIKFNDGHIKDILETIKTKYSDIDYYIRKKDNQLHIVKYNEELKLNINEFVNTLLKFYSTKMDLKPIIEGIKVKGNQNFSIVENMKSKYGGKFIDDLSRLLSKKNKD